MVCSAPIMVSSPRPRLSPVRDDIGPHKGQATLQERLSRLWLLAWDKPFQQHHFPCETRLLTKKSRINQDHICWDHVASTSVWITSPTTISLDRNFCSDPSRRTALYWLSYGRLLAALIPAILNEADPTWDQDQDHTMIASRWILFTWFC